MQKFKINLGFGRWGHHLTRDIEIMASDKTIAMELARLELLHQVKTENGGEYPAVASKFVCHNSIEEL